MEESARREGGGRARTVITLALAATLFGCVTEWTIAYSGSGFAFVISSDGGSGPPALEGDRLVVGVSYSGCSADHEFELRSRQLSPTHAEVWLYKVTPDQACTTMVRETKEFRLPANLADMTELTLRGPDGKTYPLCESSPTDDGAKN